MTSYDYRYAKKPIGEKVIDSLMDYLSDEDWYRFAKQHLLPLWDIEGKRVPPYLGSWAMGVYQSSDEVLWDSKSSSVGAELQIEHFLV